MSIQNIKTLSLNPHFFALLIQGFLSGYGKPCEFKFITMALPILLMADAREKLKSARKDSRMDTMFQAPQMIENIRISGKARLSGYIDQYEFLKPYCKTAIIILSSENKIVIDRYSNVGSCRVVLLDTIDYKKFKESLRDWIKCSYYLGVIFSKTNRAQLSYYLGVDEI